MGITSDSIGLLFRAKGDTDDAKKAFSDLRTSIGRDVGTIESTSTSGFTNVARSLGMSEASAVGLAGALPAVGAAVAVVGTAMAVTVGFAVNLTEKLFSLAESASEYGSKIYDASQKTGVGAETISALKYAAETSGSSLEKISGSLSKFSVLLGQAKDGNEKANAILKQYGITATDTDEALAQAVRTIATMSDENQAAAASAVLFKDKTGEVYNVIKSFDGDLPGLISKLKEMGLTMSDQDAAAADAFGDQLDTLKMQLEGVARTVGMAVLPVFSELFTSLGNWLTRNQDVIRNWATGIGIALQFVINRVSEAINMFRVVAKLAQGDIYGAAGQLVVGNMTPAAQSQEASGMARTGGGSRLPSGGGKGGGGKGGGPKIDPQKEQEKADSEAFKKRKEELARMLAYYEAVANRIVAKAQLDAAEGVISETKYAEIKMGAAKKVTDYKVSLIEKELEAAQEHNQSIEEIQNRLAVAKQNAQADEFKSEAKQLDDLNKLREDAAKKYLAFQTDLTSQLKAINQKRQDNFLKSEEDAWDELIEDQTGILDEQNKLRGEATGYLLNLLDREHDRQLTALDEEYAAEKAKIDKEIKDEEAKQKLLFDLDELYKQKRLLGEEEFQARKKEIEEKYAQLVPGSDGEAEPGGILGGIIGGLGTSVDDMMKKVEPIKGIGNIIGSQFNMIAQAVGNAVRSFVLLGSAGGSFRKFAAEVIASVAQMAVVQAVWELAQGFAMLALSWFTGNPKYAASATAHFSAAAIYGIVGGAAMVAGRFVAGDSFKKESSGGYGTAPNGGAGNSSSSSGSRQSGVYSSNEDQIVENGRNMPGVLGGTLTIRIKSDDSHIVETVRDNIDRNGILRLSVQDATA